MAKIQITENELKQVIRESVENVLNEAPYDYSKSWEDMSQDERNAVADKQWWRRPLRPFQSTSKQMANAQRVYTDQRNKMISGNKPIYTQAQYDEIKNQYNETKQLYDETLKSAQGLWQKLGAQDANGAYAKVDEMLKQIRQLTKANQALTNNNKALTAQNKSLTQRVQNPVSKVTPSPALQAQAQMTKPAQTLAGPKPGTAQA
jgi:cell division protein FtsB